MILRSVLFPSKVIIDYAISIYLSLDYLSFYLSILRLSIFLSICYCYSFYFLFQRYITKTITLQRRDSIYWKVYTFNRLYTNIFYSLFIRKWIISSGGSFLSFFISKYILLGIILFSSFHYHYDLDLIDFIF